MATILRPLKHFVSALFRPTLDALCFGRHLPWKLRWRLLAWQPLHLLAALTTFPPYFFRRPFKVDYIPVAPGRELRVLVYNVPKIPRDQNTNDEAQPLRPLHVDGHSGGFIGGYPEVSAHWCDLVAKRTGAVVVSLSYRLAPVHPFPAGPDDIDAAIAWLHKNAASRYGADPNLMTASGFSAGGTMLLAATQQPACHAPAPTAIKAYVAFYPVLDALTPPWEKPRPDDMPPNFLSFMEELFASYPGPDRAITGKSPRMNPKLAPLHTLPNRMLIVMPRLDILCKEILDFGARVDEECKQTGGTEHSLHIECVPDAFHGYLERKFGEIKSQAGLEKQLLTNHSPEFDNPMEEENGGFRDGPETDSRCPGGEWMATEAYWRF